MAKAGARDTASLVGRTFGEFVVRAPLSQGGFGTVFLAEQPALGREAVIKVLHLRLLASETVVQRFMREARLASALDHPYAAHTYGFGLESDGVLWIAYELVRGTPLDKLLDAQGRIPLERYVPLLERLCEVVHTAHEQGIVHRDIKPANVMVLSRAGRLLPKLLDLGIAKVSEDSDTHTISGSHRAITSPPEMALPVGTPTGIGLSRTTDGALDETAAPSSAMDETVASSSAVDETMPLEREGNRAPPMPRWQGVTPAGLSATGDSQDNLRLTLDGASMGSPLYMAPEQWSDAATVDARCDIYALAVLSYEALTGRPPFLGQNQMEVAAKHAQAPVPSLGEGFPAALDAVLGRAMAKVPADRFATALDLASAFREASGLAGEPITFATLPDEVVQRALAEAPQPLAQAVAGLQTARNPRQARDALWLLVRVAVRLVGIIALASHSHVRADLGSTDPDLADGLRRLRQRSLSDRAWLELARELADRFANMREAYPVPDLIDLLFDEGGVGVLDRLVEEAEQASESGSATEQQIRERLDRCMPLAERLLIRLQFLSTYRLVVSTANGAEEWMGMRRPRRVERELPTPVDPGRPLLLDGDGVPVVFLWPFIQLTEPSPGQSPALFLLEGQGRRGARLVAWPDGFECEDENLWDAFGVMLSDSLEQSDDPSDERSPYPGLAAFSRDDSDSFFGREREVESFLNRLRSQPLLCVAGPSGAGKSSFVQAGVVPGLSEEWTAIVVRPGPVPLVALAARLSEAGIDAGHLADELIEHPGALGVSLRNWAQSNDRKVLLVVDQLEELFTLCEDESERAIYGEALVRAARSADEPIRVIFTLRDDFLTRAESLPAFRSRLGQGLQILTTPAKPDLRRILIQPLRRRGYEFDDPGLPDEMVESLGDAPGALALLSFTASKLWELRDRRFKQIARKAYDSLGGVGGALAKHAEDTLQEMTAEEKRLTREVFRHAVTAEGTRAVLSRNELMQVLGNSRQASSVVEKLLGSRLLVVSDDAAGERIEVAHEALLSAWPRLVRWQREDAEGARLRDQLRAAARQWEERGRPSGLLWRGDALAEYRLWRSRYPGLLTDAEEAFASASLGEAIRGRRIRTILVAGALAGLAVVAVVLLFQNTRVEKQRARAEASQKAVQKSADEMQELLRSQYQAQGRRLLLADDPLLAMAYLDEAKKLGARGPVFDFLAALAIERSDGLIRAVELDTKVRRVQFSPDGALIAAATLAGGMIFDSGGTQPKHRFDSEHGIRRLAWSSNGQSIAFARDDGAVTVYQPESGEKRFTLAGSTGAVAQAIEFSPDDAWIATVDVRDTVKLWRGDSGELVETLHQGDEPGMPVGDVLNFSPDGSLVAAGDMRGVVRIWEVSGGRLRAALPMPSKSRVSHVVFADRADVLVATAGKEVAIWNLTTRRLSSSYVHEAEILVCRLGPDGRRLLTGSSDGVAQLRDIETARVIHRWPHRAPIFAGDWSPRGDKVAIATDDRAVHLWSTSHGQPLATLRGHRNLLTSVDFDHRGRQLISSADDHTLRLWNAEAAEEMTQLEGHAAMITAIESSPDGHRIFTTSYDKTLRLWDRASGREIVSATRDREVIGLDVSPDGSRLATVDIAGTNIDIWDAHKLEHRTELAGHDGPVHAMVWQPDGKLLVSGGQDGTVRYWDPDGSRMTRTIQVGGPVLAVDFLGGGTELLVVIDGTAQIRDPASGRMLRELAIESDAFPVAAHPTEPVMVIAASQTIQVVSAVDGSVLSELVGHLGAAMKVGWSPNGDLVVTATVDGTVRFWDPATGDLLAVFTHDDPLVSAADLTPDGKNLISAWGNGGLMIRPLPGTHRVAELSQLVACRVPYAITEDGVVGRIPDLGACPPGD